jgi:hypothetical protein
LGLIPLTQIFLIFPKFTCKLINWGSYLNYPKEPTFNEALTCILALLQHQSSLHQNSLKTPIVLENKEMEKEWFDKCFE